MSATEARPTHPARTDDPALAPNPKGDRSGFWISLAVLVAFAVFIAVGFLGAYFLM